MKILYVRGRGTDGHGNMGVLHNEMTRRLGIEHGIRVPVQNRRLSTFWGGKSDGKRIAFYARPGDIIVGHSYAAVRIWHAHKLVEFKAIILIGPAHSQFAEWRNPQRTWCYHSKGDNAIRLGAYVPFHPYGRAGRDGYRQLEPAGGNIDSTPADHNDYFDMNREWFQKICGRLEHLWNM